VWHNITGIAGVGIVGVGITGVRIAVCTDVRQASVILASVRHQTHCGVEDPL